MTTRDTVQPGPSLYERHCSLTQTAPNWNSLSETHRASWQALAAFVDQFVAAFPNDQPAAFPMDDPCGALIEWACPQQITGVEVHLDLSLDLYDLRVTPDGKVFTTAQPLGLDAAVAWVQGARNRT